MRAGAAVTLVLLTLVGCSVGPSAEKFVPAQGPAGVQATLQIQARIVIGELLAVEQSGLLVLGGRRVRRVPYAAIRHGSFAQVGESIADGRTPSADTRERLRLVSRFPQGLSQQLLRELLAVYGQDEVEEVNR